MQASSASNARDTRGNEIERLEHAFWKSLVDRDADAARGMLAPEALMVSAHGTMRFDPAQYEKMLLDPKHGLLEYTLSENSRRLVEFHHQEHVEQREQEHDNRRHHAEK